MNDNNQSIVRGDIGFVFQFYNVVPNLNVEENIALSILFRRKKIKSYKKKIDDILKIVELESRSKSDGQQKR
jgi:putative ABC transport system ATP-binding protein